MNYYDKELKMYADSDLRTAEDWTLRGRVVESGTSPRVDTVHRGKPISLFGRNQTRMVRGSRNQPPVSVAAPRH